MRRALEGGKKVSVTPTTDGAMRDRWSDEARMLGLFGHDAVKELNEFLDSVAVSNDARL